LVLLKKRMERRRVAWFLLLEAFVRLTVVAPVQHIMQGTATRG
jgi:hypothetical protein